MVHETMMPVNGIDMCVETFGEPTEPPLLLLSGDAGSMDWWDDEFCRRLAAGSRFVIRYDHRDTGRSTSCPLGEPDYSGTDLLHDAVGVLDALRVQAAHLVGFSFGSALAQRLAIHHPSRVLSLTLIAAAVDNLPVAGPPPASAFPSTGLPSTGLPSTGLPSTGRPGSGPPATVLPTAGRPGSGPPGVGRPGAGPSSADLPPLGPPVALGGPLPVSTPKIKPAVGTVEARPATLEVDWSNRRSAVNRMIDEAQASGGPFTPDEPQLRRLAERIFDRSTDLAATRLNHQLAGYGPPIRDLLCTIETPTVVLHGTLDHHFPADHPEELARSIPGARLVWLEGVGHEPPPRAVWTQVLSEILTVAP